MQNNIGSIIFPNEWGIGHYLHCLAVDQSFRLCDEKSGQKQDGQICRLVNYCEGFCRQLARRRGRPETIELTGFVN